MKTEFTVDKEKLEKIISDEFYDLEKLRYVEDTVLLVGEVGDFQFHLTITRDPEVTFNDVDEALKCIEVKE